MVDGPASGFVFKPSRDWGRDAKGYFNEYRQQLKEYTEPREAIDRSPQIRIPGRLASGDDPVAPQLHEWAELLYNNGYDYRVGYCQYFKPAANKRSRDKVIDRSYLEAVKRNKSKIKLAYERADGERSWKLDWSTSYVWPKPSIDSVDKLKEEIKND